MCQDYTNAEIILSDDGSTKYDTSELNKYAEELKKVFADVRININEQNVGTVKHLNKIISMDKNDKTKVENLVKGLKKQDFLANVNLFNLKQSLIKPNNLISSFLHSSFSFSKHPSYTTNCMN